MIDLSKYKIGLSEDIVKKLYVFVDLQKLKGLNGPQASSKFQDYLGFLQIPETQELLEFFADRWNDHRVRIEVPKEYYKYIHSEHPMFTPPRLEPPLDDKPYYQLGLRDLPGATPYNEEFGGNVLIAQIPVEDYSYFIIDQFVPNKFYVMVINEQVPRILEKGFPKTSYDNPLMLFDNPDKCRAKFLSKMQAHGSSAHDKLSKGSLISIDSEGLKLNNDLLFTERHSTKKIHKTLGYFYIGAIPPQACKVES